MSIGQHPKSPVFWLGVSRRPGTIVVRLDGALDLGASAILGDILTDLIDGQGNLAVAVDLRNLGPVDRAGLDVLATAAAAIERRGGELTLTGTPDPLVDALRAAGLGRLVGHIRPPDPCPARRVDTAGRSRHPAGSALDRPWPRP